MVSSIKQLEDTCNELAKEIIRLNKEIEDTQKRDEEQRTMDEKTHQASLVYYDHQIRVNEKELYEILEPKD